MQHAGESCAKAPVPGRVKTRLCPPCTPEQAAAVAAAALADTLDAVTPPDAARRTLVLDGAYPAPAGWRTVAQRGDRAGRAARPRVRRHRRTRPGQPAGRHGHPQLTPDLLAELIERLAAGADAVLGPAARRRLVGARLCAIPAQARVLRDVPMSTPDTGAGTLAALARRRLRGRDRTRAARRRHRRRRARGRRPGPGRPVRRRCRDRAAGGRAPSHRGAGGPVTADVLLRGGGAVTAPLALYGAALRRAADGRPTPLDLVRIDGVGATALDAGRLVGRAAPRRPRAAAPLPRGHPRRRLRAGPAGRRADPRRADRAGRRHLAPRRSARPAGRGAAALRGCVFEPLPGEGGWRHLLLADGNIGIGGDPARLLRALPRRCCRTGGAVLVECAPPGRGQLAGRRRLRAPAAGRASPFPWAGVGAHDCRRAGPPVRPAGPTTWTEADRWFADLTAAEPPLTGLLHRPAARPARVRCAADRCARKAFTSRLRSPRLTSRLGLCSASRSGSASLTGLLSHHPAPAVLVLVAVAAGRAVPGHPGPARGDRPGHHPAAGRQAVVGLPAAVRLAAGPRPAPRRRTAVGAGPGRRGPVPARHRRAQHRPLVRADAVLLHRRPLLGAPGWRSARCWCTSRSSCRSSGGAAPAGRARPDVAAAGGLSRRGLLAGVGAAAGVITLATIGQTVRPLQDRLGAGPAGPTSGRKACRSTRPRGGRRRRPGPDPGYRLVVTGPPGRCACPWPSWPRCPSTPCSCRSPASRGGAPTATWTGVRVRDLLALVGATPDSAATVESLQPAAGTRRPRWTPARRRPADPARAAAQRRAAAPRPRLPGPAHRPEPARRPADQMGRPARAVTP